MADITVTTTAVIPASNAKKVTGVAGEALTIGQAVYKKTTDKRWWKSDKDAVETALEYGIALSTTTAAAQGVVVQIGGDLAFGAILTVGETYVVGEAAGGIAPIADVGTGEYSRILGQATTTSNLTVKPQTIQVAHS
jgi:hypothetical protein